MEENFINLTLENFKNEHICCAISDKKHKLGVEMKKKWLQERIKEGHTFRKLNVNGKVFIEYAPLETAWVPISGKNYLYIYCLWVAGSYKGNHYGEKLLNYCIEDAKKQNKIGICIISSKKKKPYISDKKFFEKYGFTVADRIDEEYELLTLAFDNNTEYPKFTDDAKKQSIKEKDITIYYTNQCPFIVNCIKEIKEYSVKNNVKIIFNEIDSLEKAKSIPCVFNNFVIFINGKFVTNTLQNGNMLSKLLSK